MNVSVIIPVYNALEFIEQAVSSAHIHADVKEILVIDDGSTDGSLDLCLRIEERYAKVKVLQHPDGVNRGASASRNLGISHATQELIAFLDADDVYLPNRFDAERTIFSQCPDIDGVYGATEAEFITEAGKKRFNDARMKPLTTISHWVAPDEVVWVLFGMSVHATGHFSCDALTVKKDLLRKTGGFDHALSYGEDTDLIIRMSVMGKLAAGSIERPVAVRGVHDANRVTNVKVANQHKEVFWSKIFEWGRVHGMPQELVDASRIRALSWKTHSKGVVFGIAFLVKMPYKHPDLWSSPQYYRRSVFGVFGETFLSKALVRIRRFPKMQ